MARLAVEASNWIDVDDWEVTQPHYMRTALVLERICERLNDALRLSGPDRSSHQFIGNAQQSGLLSNSFVELTCLIP